MNDEATARREHERKELLGVFSDYGFPCRTAAQARLIWEAQRSKMIKLEELLSEAKREHFTGRDERYTCPQSLSEEGRRHWFGNRSDCNCGADDWNEKVDKCLAS